MGELNKRLRELRASAVPTISLEEMAAELGFDSRQAYHHYERENGFKGRYLAPELARRIAGVLQDRGVDPDEVMALAGLSARESAAPHLSRAQEEWLAFFDRLTAKQRKLLLQMAEEMTGPPAGDDPGLRPSTTVHVPARAYRAEPLG